MFTNTKAYSGFAVDDVSRAREFYGETLGLRTSESHGLLTLHLAGDRDTLVYPKPDHEPAGYTVLNFPVDDIDQAVDALSARGVDFERYDGGGRAGCLAGRRALHRLVQGSGRQRAVGSPGEVGPNRRPSVVIRGTRRPRGALRGEDYGYPS